MIPNNYRELNYSKIKTYRVCPYLYKLKYVEGRREGLIAASSLGVSIHKTLEEYHLNSNNPEDLLSYYNRCFLGAGYKSAGEQMEYYLKGKRMLDTYVKQDISHPHEIKSCEKEFVFDYEGWSFRGKIDRFDILEDNSARVIDYKTDAEIADDFDIKKSLQMALYSIGARRAWGQEKGQVAIYFTTFGKVFSADFSLFNEEEILKSCIETGLLMEGDTFPPNTSSCAYCLMNNRCPHSTVKREE